jgi:hypothetical protein
MAKYWYTYLMVIWNILWPFVVIWYFFPVLVCLDEEKSGNPVRVHSQLCRFSSDAGVALREQKPHLPETTLLFIGSALWKSFGNKRKTNSPGTHFLHKHVWKPSPNRILQPLMAKS